MRQTKNRQSDVCLFLKAEFKWYKQRLLLGRVELCR